jgi:hypothetical protein
LQLAVIVAVSAVGVMEVTVHQIIDVVAVGHCFVAAIGTMGVRLLMSMAGMTRRAFFRIYRINLNSVFFNAAVPLVMQMTVVQVVCVAVMIYSRVTTIRPMLVAMSS